MIARLPLRCLLGITVLTFAAPALAGDTSVSDPWTSWELVSAEGWRDQHPVGWQISFHEDGRLSTSWLGPMYESEAASELATLEILEAIGEYVFAGGRVQFSNDDSLGWLWEWRRVSCDFAESVNELRLTNCVGRDAWSDEEAAPAQPGDMTFKKLGR